MYKYMNNFLLFVLVGIIVYFWNSIESFSDEKDELDFIKAVQRFIDEEVKYSDYIKFLSNYGDKYKKLETVNIFKIFKQFQQIGELSVENIKKIMREQ